MTIDRTNSTVILTTEEMNNIKAINAESRNEAMEQVTKIVNGERRYSAKPNLVKATNDIYVDETILVDVKYSKGKVKTLFFIDVDNLFYASIKIK